MHFKVYVHTPTLLFFFFLTDALGTMSMVTQYISISRLRGQKLIFLQVHCVLCHQPTPWLCIRMNKRGNIVRNILKSLFSWVRRKF